MIDQSPHRYVSRGGLLVAVDGSIVRLCRIFANARSPFAMREPSAHRWLKVLPPIVLMPARLLRTLLVVLRARITGAASSSLPVAADVAIRCRPHGFKYFDFGLGKVIVDAGPGLGDEGFSDYLRMLKAVGGAGLGPWIGELESDGNRYEEGLVEGERIRSILDEWGRMESPVVEFIAGLTRIAGPRVVPLQEYRKNLVRQWRLVRGSFQGRDDPGSRFRAVDDCWDWYLDRVADSPVRETSLGLTHGDFREKNFSLVGGRIVAVDWLTAGERSVLYDLYSILFTALVHVQAVDDDVRALVYRRLAEARLRLIPDGVGDSDETFDLFVLEFLLLRFRHFIAPYGVESDFGGRMLSQVDRYIHEFDRYRSLAVPQSGAVALQSRTVPCAV